MALHDSVVAVDIVGIDQARPYQLDLGEGRSWSCVATEEDVDVEGHTAAGHVVAVDDGKVDCHQSAVGDTRYGSHCDRLDGLETAHIGYGLPQDLA